MQGGGSLIPVIWPILEQNMGAIATAVTTLGALYDVQPGNQRHQGLVQPGTQRRQKVLKDVKVVFSQEIREVKVGFGALVDKLNTVIIMGAVVFTAYAVTSVQALLMASRS